MHFLIYYARGIVLIVEWVLVQVKKVISFFLLVGYRPFIRSFNRTHSIARASSPFHSLDQLIQSVPHSVANFFPPSPMLVFVTRKLIHPSNQPFPNQCTFETFGC